MHNTDLCGIDIPTAPGKQLPMPLPALLHAPRKGNLGSAVLMEIQDTCSDAEAPRLHRAKGQVSHPSNFFYKDTQQSHTGSVEQVFRHYTEVSFYNKAPLHSWEHLKVGTQLLPKLEPQAESEDKQVSRISW